MNHWTTLTLKQNSEGPPRRRVFSIALWRIWFISMDMKIVDIISFYSKHETRGRISNMIFADDICQMSNFVSCCETGHICWWISVYLFKHYYCLLVLWIYGLPRFRSRITRGCIKNGHQSYHFPRFLHAACRCLKQNRLEIFPSQRYHLRNI